MRKFVIFGVGGHALSIADLLTNMQDSVVFFCTDRDTMPVPKGFKQISVSELRDNPEDFEVVIGVGETEARAKIIKLLAGLECHYPVVIHPRAYVSNSATIGQGTVVFSNAYLGPETQIGEFVIINTGAIVEHNARVSNSVILSPSVTLAGGSIVGEGTFIGMAACVSPKVQIGDECIIGANSFVNSHIPSHSKAFGTPAKVCSK